ncbi:uroporphyrinogen-III C-methyltransferase, partial [Klebsiella pneumoniae]|uniref:uroporphyrinogen-III C-methyltransferase n=1 Tax=Klebsiella pneumoniae TaxID=573 RepID=UPI00272F10B0
NTDDATTKAFLDEVDQLSQQNISMDLPETLQSQAMLEKLMQTRVCNLLAQPAAGTTEAKPAPAPQADTPAAAPQGE